MTKIFNEDRTLYWLAIDVANQAGHDKLKFDERVAIVVDNFKALKKYNDGIQNPMFLETALMELATHDAFTKLESEHGLINAVKAMFTYISTGHCDHMVYLDASNQALQLYGVLTADKKTASTCNIANGEDLVDAYGMLADALNQVMKTSMFNRTICKKALMTTMYGKRGAHLMILETMYPNSAEPMLEFYIAITGNQHPERYQVTEMEERLENSFHSALMVIAPRAIEAMEAIQMLNNPNIGLYHWTLPDGFHVKYDVKKDIIAQIYTHTKTNLIVQLAYETVVYGPSEKNAGMAPNLIHSVDGYIVREMIRRMNGKFITTIHDAFACHPADCDFMIQNYKDILCELLKSNLLNQIKHAIAVPKYANTLPQDIPAIEVDSRQDNELTCEDIQNSRYLLS